MSVDHLQVQLGSPETALIQPVTSPVPSLMLDAIMVTISFSCNSYEGILFLILDYCNCLGTNCVNNSVRLIEVPSSIKKIVEVCKDGVWGSITSYRWNNQAARVICRQLGLPWQSKF